MVSHYSKFIFIYIVGFAILFYSCNDKENEPCPELPNYSNSKKEFKEDFENGLQSFWTKELADSTRMDIVKDSFNPKNKILKIDLNLEDYASGGIRSEILMHPKDSFGYKANYSFKFLLPDSFFQKGEPQGWYIIHQWHDAPAPGFNWKTYNRKTQPPIHLLIEHNPNGEYFLYFKTGLEIGEIKEIVPVKWKNKLEPNKWYTFSCEILWSLYNKEGYAAPKLDGEYFLNQTSPNDTLVNHKIYRRNMYNIIPNYFKFGLYRSGRENYNRTIYFDDFKFESQRIK